MLDTFGRPLKSLRVSLIDKCNLRCQYCMPEEEYVWLPREDILTVDEIGELVDVFSELGVDRVRLTGGEGRVEYDKAVGSEKKDDEEAGEEDDQQLLAARN